jgi:hypothetical protein
MKDLLKSIIPQVPIYILIIYLMWFFSDKDKLSAADVLNQLNQKDSIISQMIDDQGRLVLSHTNRQYSPMVIQNSNDPEMVELREELKSLGISLNDLKSAVNIKTQATGNGETEIVQLTDTLDVYSFKDSTKHIKIAGLVDVKNNKLNYNYTYSAEYKLFSYDYKKKFWKRPELQLKLISDDPSNKIQMQTFTVKPPREIVSIGVGIGAAFYYADGKFGVAPAITVGIFKPIYTFRTKN